MPRSCALLRFRKLLIESVRIRKMKGSFFSTRWGMVLAVIGIAVGTGNIWRFSRIVAQNGGGSFLIAWVVFLLIWSVPLIIAEFAIGRKTRLGTTGSIGQIAGPQYAWMGGFIAFVAIAIMFYYSVVTGWCLKYFTLSVTGELMRSASHPDLWTSFTQSREPILFHAIAMVLAAMIIYNGVRGIERVARVLIPSLLVILLIIAVRAITLPGAFRGIVYLFTPDLTTMVDYRVWLAALTQNAWDTGAGWGLILTYACYARKQEDVAVNGALTAFANNSVSLLAGITIFSTVFALGASDGIQELISGRGSTNTGLAFIFLPELFTRLPGSILTQSFFSTIFFLGLFFAAVTSLISMLELGVKVFQDMGFKRKPAILGIMIVGFLFGIPSALNMQFFENQDFVWGIALMISGAFICFALIRYGVTRFREESINHSGSDIRVGKWFDFLIIWLIPIEAIVLIVWWFYLAITSFDREGWWNPWNTYSIATCLLQWGIAFAILLSLNRWVVRRTLSGVQQ